MNKEYKSLSLLYIFIVITLLVIQYYFQLPHPEWGLLTLPLIFSPTKSHFIQKSIHRVLATVVGAIMLISISFIENPFIYYAALVSLVLGTGHLSIKYKQHFYFFFIIIITIGIFGLGNFINADSSHLKLGIAQRIGETILGCIAVILPTIAYLYFRKHVAFPEQKERKIEEVTHLQFFLRGVFSYLLFLLIYIYVNDKLFQGAATMLTILIGATSIHKNPMKDIMMTIRVVFLSTLGVFITKWIGNHTSSFISPYLYILVIGVLFGILMYCSFRFPSKSFYFRMLMVIGPVIYSLTPSTVQHPDIFAKILGLFLFGGLLSIIGHHLSHQIHKKVKVN